MKSLRKIMALLIAMIMVIGMSVAVFAQTVGTASSTTGKITINNPAKGETYKLHKLFDATVDEDGNIAYTATTIPSGLTGFFEVQNGYVYPKDSIAIKDDNGKITGTKMTTELKAALETWAKTAAVTAQTPQSGSDGTELVFQGLPYGYYVMTTTHTSDAASDETPKAAISVTSTNPEATINDKNVNEPTAKKESDKQSYSVGDPVTYTATFNAPNFMEDTSEGAEEGASEQVVSYTITDTLPDFLSNVAITSIKVKQPGVTPDVTGSTATAFDENGTITVPWVEETTIPNETHKYTSKYKAGSQIIVTYTAKLTSLANVGAANENKVSIMPNVDRGKNKPEPYQEEDEWNDTASITTHAAKLIKVDGENNATALKGAKFTFKGLTLTGEKGIYTVVSYDPNGGAGTEVQVADDGTLTIGGIDKGITLIGTETEPPKGYNKMSGTFNLATVQMATTTTTTWGKRTIYYDADGNVVDEEVEDGSSQEVSNGQYASISDIPAASVVKVENNKGTVLPATGGIGTTIFYIVGGILVAGAAIILIAKRRTRV